ncbi:hypothetical protein Rumeso_01681 [Rubellimicrobium mesophilum DSM 19309]|uniref:Protein NnrT n=1 Tax=Rubellimicrobium mesophilum DSM 19309 TaxID=442562 RepID=A0A017HRD3_9RHOB|nr:hypothetical protein [Rubellimicrobium mesophilum]EYD76723.1 hypothetical protein Rumeso_01681 [Rubellimicrobium mesophilum DSM 19309]
MKALILLLTLLPGAALAQAVELPAPPPYSSGDQFWFAVASVAMVVMLAAVHWLVRRR